MSHTDYISRYRYVDSFYTPTFAIRGFKLSKHKVKCVGHYLFNKTKPKYLVEPALVAVTSSDLVCLTLRGIYLCTAALTTTAF